MAQPIPISQAVIELTRNIGFSVEQDGTVEFFDKSEPPSKKDVLAKWEELKTHYTVKRKESYPNFAEQFDKLFHDMTAGKGTKDGEWYKAIAKVKADNPKE